VIIVVTVPAVFAHGRHHCFAGLSHGIEPSDGLRRFQVKTDGPSVINYTKIKFLGFYCLTGFKTDGPLVIIRRLIILRKFRGAFDYFTQVTSDEMAHFPHAEKERR
jgi:hypothetical protein